MFELIHTEDRPAIHSAVHFPPSTPPGIRDEETRISYKNGERSWAESRAYTHLQEPVTAAIVIDGREASAKVNSRRESHVHSSHPVKANVELEHFAYSVAHDSREPLHGLSMSTEMLAKGEHLDSFEGLHLLPLRGFDPTRSTTDLEQAVSDARQNLARGMADSVPQVITEPLAGVKGTNAQLVRLLRNVVLNPVKNRISAEPNIQIPSRCNGDSLAAAGRGRTFKSLKTGGVLFAQACSAHPSSSEFLLGDILKRSIRIEEDLGYQLFNSSEEHPARALLLKGNFEKKDKPETVTTKISQETLAATIGVTRSRVSFFMNQCLRLGFIKYNGTLEEHSSLLNVVLHE